MKLPKEVEKKLSEFELMDREEAMYEAMDILAEQRERREAMDKEEYQA
jgi:hypothetical protein